MTDPTQLYRELLLDHARSPRHRGRLPAPARVGEVSNALCGDRATLSILVEDGVVAAVACAGEGCAISVAAASMFACAIAGRPVAEVRSVAAAIRALVTSGSDAELGELRALASVAAFPSRRRCATLVCDALDVALG